MERNQAEKKIGMVIWRLYGKKTIEKLFLLLKKVTVNKRQKIRDATEAQNNRSYGCLYICLTFFCLGLTSVKIRCFPCHCCR